jgi:glyoxylase I family protein
MPSRGVAVRASGVSIILEAGRSAQHASQQTVAAEEQSTMTFPPLTHVAITVRDLGVSVPWYEALFEAEPVLDEDTDPHMHHTVYMLGGTLIGLHQHETAAPAESFSEYRVGLDHIAFGCENRAELEKWEKRLDELGVAHGGIKDASYGSGLSFRDPDGIALEFFAPPA